MTTLWPVELLLAARDEMAALPPDMRASFERIVNLIQAQGLERVHEPYIKHLEGPLLEMRLKGKAGIARALYVAAIGRRLVCASCVCEEEAENTATRDRACA